MIKIIPVIMIKVMEIRCKVVTSNFHKIPDLATGSVKLFPKTL